MREPYTKEELNQIAVDLFNGTKFISWGVPEHMIESIFLPLVFMNEDTKHKLISMGPTAFFADSKDASPIGVNGYPIFWSMGFLTKNEEDQVCKMLTKLQNTQHRALRSRWQNLKEDVKSIINKINIWRKDDKNPSSTFDS